MYPEKPSGEYCQAIYRTYLERSTLVSTTMELLSSRMVPVRATNWLVSIHTVRKETVIGADPRHVVSSPRV